MTADDFVRLAGTNRIAASGSMDITLDFYFNSMDFDQAAITVEATDDNAHAITFNIGSIEVEFHDGVL